MSGVRVLTTVPADFEAMRESGAVHGNGLDVVDRASCSRAGLVRRIVTAAERYDAVLLNGSGREDQIAAALLARRRAAPPVVIADSTWQRGTWWLDRLVCRVGIRAVDSPCVTYCVLSSDELELFPRTWGVAPDRVAFTPFCYTLPEGALVEPTSCDGGVFAGGDSMRDYAPLLEATTLLGVDATFAVQHPPAAWRRRAGAKVHVGPVSHERFLQLMRHAATVVVPLRDGIERSAGQQTYLNAMAMGKVVIVTDSPGARDYIEDGVTGLIVPPGDADALADALTRVLDPRRAEDTREMAARARSVARTRFRPVDHLRSMLGVVDEAARRAARS